MLEYQVRLAEDLGIYQTVEYEEANRKLMNLAIIEEKLEESRVRIKKDTKRLNWCICLIFFLLLIMFYFVIVFGTSKPDLTLSNAQKLAEREMLQYNNGYITNIKTDASKHKSVIEEYKNIQQKNLKSVKTILNAPVSQIKIQVKYLIEMINNK